MRKALHNERTKNRFFEEAKKTAGQPAALSEVEEQRVKAHAGLVRNEAENAKKRYDLVGKGPIDPLAGVDAEDFDVGGVDDLDIPGEDGLEETDDQAAYREPYVISYDEFAEEHNEYSKITLYYYVDDDTICGEDEEIIAEYDEFIGWDALNYLEVNTTVWVRNDRIAADYEVTRVNGSYQELIMGEPPLNLSPREKQQWMAKHKRDSDE